MLLKGAGVVRYCAAQGGRGGLIIHILYCQ